MCDNLLVPSYLHTNLRKPDQIFADSELLFRHFIPVVADEIPGDQIDVKQTSMNRNKYLNNPNDSLYSLRDYTLKNNYKVFGIQVDKLRNFISKLEDKKLIRLFSFSILHDPTPCMYPHTIVQAFENGSPVAEIKPNSIKNKYRMFIAEHSTIY